MILACSRNSFEPICVILKNNSAAKSEIIHLILSDLSCVKEGLIQPNLEKTKKKYYFSCNDSQQMGILEMSNWFTEKYNSVPVKYILFNIITYKYYYGEWDKRHSQLLFINVLIQWPYKEHPLSDITVIADHRDVPLATTYLIVMDIFQFVQPAQANV